MEYVVGIDIGTGSVKAVALKLDGTTIDVAQNYYTSNSPVPGFHEQNPEEIWTAFVLTLQQLQSKINYSPLAISLSSAMHSLMAVNENGEPLGPMMTWADNRAAAIAKALVETPEGKEIYKATGTPIHAMSPLCKLIWLGYQQAQMFQNAHKFISIKEYIWYKLFGVFEIDHSIASCTGLFHLQQLKWHDAALKQSKLTAARLSIPVPTNFSRKFMGHPQLSFMEKDIPFFIGASDGCLANLGSMAYQPGVAVMTIGTSGAVRMASNKPLPNESAMTFSYILDAETFICGGPINNGGIALQWWLKNCGETLLTDEVYQRFFQSLNDVPAASRGLLFLPYLTGERAPIWDSESCGSFFGITLQHQRHHFSKAVIEGICYAMRNVLEAIADHKQPITHIHISGGFVKSEVWVQLLADITGKKLVLVQTDDASALGAAYLAMKGLNLIDGYPEAKRNKLKTIAPNPVHREVYSKNFEIFKKLYADLKDTMHQLHHINI